MTYSFLEKNIAKPWETIGIINNCGWSGTYDTWDHTIANIWAGNTVITTGIWKTEVFETSNNCTDTGNMSLQVTEDWLPYIIDSTDYGYICSIEVLIVAIIIGIASVNRFYKWLP